MARKTTTTVTEETPDQPVPVPVPVPDPIPEPALNPEPVHVADLTPMASLSMAELEAKLQESYDRGKLDGQAQTPEQVDAILARVQAAYEAGQANVREQIPAIQGKIQNALEEGKNFGRAEVEAKYQNTKGETVSEVHKIVLDFYDAEIAKGPTSIKEKFDRLMKLLGL